MNLQERINEYELNPKYCLYCGKKLLFNRRFNKCCNQSCANSYSNLKRGKHSKETNEKISKSLNNTNIKLGKTRIKDNLNLVIKYYNNEINFEEIRKIKPELIRKCECCGKEFIPKITKAIRISGSKYCSNECLDKSMKEKVSQKVQERIKNGTFSGWKSRNIISYAEKFWVKVLDNNQIPYIREYLLEYGDLHNGERYFLDFYIEINNRKIDLEIDGKQHQYEDRKELDIKRDKFISSQGIEIYRIVWNEIKTKKGSNLMKEKIDKFLEFIK